MTMSASNVEVQTAQLLLEKLGVTLEDLIAAQSKRPMPTFAEYVPIVYAAIPPNRTRDLYSSYWNRIVEMWPSRRLDYH